MTNKLTQGCLLGVFLVFGCNALAQQLEREPAPPGEKRSPRYLSEHAVDYRTLLAPPPAPGSFEDNADVTEVKELQNIDQKRWEEAQLDAAFLYPRFEDAFGHPIDRATSPMLVKLLNRTLQEVGAATSAAKMHFHRPRPYQRWLLQRVCGQETPSQPEEHPDGGLSYPSGHSAFGWAVAMVLSRVEPDRADVLMERADRYAQNRLICGVHFPSDLEAGHVIAAAVIARLSASPEFQKDLAGARTEQRSH
jgi:acid phosphatase (class A)